MAFTLDLRKKNKTEPEVQVVQPSPTPLPETAKEPDSPEPRVLIWKADLSRSMSLHKAVIVAMILTAGAVLAMYFMRDYLFGVLLILGGVAILAGAFRQPESATIRLDKVSISIDDRRYLFSQLKSFWLNYDPPRMKELILVMRRPLLPAMRIPLADTNPLEIRENMVSLVAETEYEDSLMDHLVRKLSR